jgi:hypothetical protein
MAKTAYEVRTLAVGLPFPPAQGVPAAVAPVSPEAFLISLDREFELLVGSRAG